MVGYEGLCPGFEWWWLFPAAMIVLCLVMIRRGMGGMMCRPSSRRSTDTRLPSFSDSAREILDKRYALGEISKDEYEEKRKDIDQTSG